MKDILKQSLIVIVLLFLIAVGWLALKVFLVRESLDINNQAQEYVKTMPVALDEEVLRNMDQRTDNLPIKPREFKELVNSAKVEKPPENF